MNIMSSMGRTALVTGGTRGIGLGIVQLLLQEGWTVFTIARGLTPVQHERLRHFRADLGVANETRDVITRIEGSLKQLDLLVNNAGAMQASEDWDVVTAESMLTSYQLHSISPMLLIKELAPLMIGSPVASIVNIGSVYGRVPDPEVVAYGCAKAAQDYITRVAASRLAPNIRVNSIHPGHVETDMTLGAPEDFLDGIKAKIPQRRLETISEVVNVVKFLACPESSGMTGSVVTIDGGFSGQGP